MKDLLTPRNVLAALLMGLGSSSHALSVGPLVGDAAIGRPLSLSSAVQFDGGDADASCVRAEVFYGDNALPAGQVRVSLQQAPGSGPATVRLHSPLPIDEPVVTVVMHAGCRSATTRRFVVLAEPARSEETALAAREPVAPLLVQARALGAAPATLAMALPLAGRATAGRAAPVPAARTARPLAMSTELGRAAPRLKMEVADIPASRLPWLRTSTQLAGGPSADATQRAAAALLWQALNMQPQEVLRLNDRMRTLETELGALRQTATRNRGEIARMQDQVGGTGSSSWPLVAALLALVAATSGFLGYRTSVARRPQAAGVWGEVREADSERGPETDLDHLDDALQAPPILAPQRAQEPQPAARQAAPADSAADVARVLRPAPRQPLAGDAPRAPVPELPPLEFDLSASRQPGLAAPPAERRYSGAQAGALAEALQQAEFLLSLGYGERAIDVLRNYIESTVQPPALALLELLALCRQSGDADAVAASAQDWRRVFGEEPPPDDLGAGLESCPAALARLEAAWRDGRSLAVLEELLFSPPHALGGVPGLAAWRDLFWLYGLARETHGLADAPANPDGDIEPGAELTLERLEQIEIARAAARFGVDVDLGGVDLERHKVLDLQAVPRLPPLPDRKLVPTPVRPAPAKVAAQHDEDAFDAFAAAEGRNLYLQR